MVICYTPEFCGRKINMKLEVCTCNYRLYRFHGCSMLNNNMLLIWFDMLNSQVFAKRWRRSSFGWHVVYQLTSPMSHVFVWEEVVFMWEDVWSPTSDQPIHPGRLTWNLQITHLERKMIFQTSMIMFHVNLQGCMFIWETLGWWDRFLVFWDCHKKLKDDELLPGWMGFTANMLPSQKG